MPQTDPPLAMIYQGWNIYQSMLAELLEPLSTEQLAVTLDGERPAWLLAAHIIGTRVGWFQGALEIGKDDPAMVDYETWDHDDAPPHPRSGAELARGLRDTWRMMQDGIADWPSEAFAATFTTPSGQTRTRGWVLWHVLEHDLHHGGELCLTLGTHGVTVPDF
jgi:uncharacterized damage-inducible protein DinB